MRQTPSPSGTLTVFDRSRALTLTAVQLIAQTRTATAEAHVLCAWAQAVRRRRIIAGGSGAANEPADRSERRLLTQTRLNEPAHATAAFHLLWLRGLRTAASWRYAIGIGAALVPALLRIVVNPYWGTRFPYIFYFPSTLFTALFCGLGPAWVGIGLSAVMTAVWILPPIDSPAVSSPLDLVGLAVFIVADGIVAWIGASHRDLIAFSERQSRELAMRRQEAETANRAKDDFLAVLSHELRTPLTTIVAGVRVMRRAISLGDTASRPLEAIERQADHLTRLVDDLLDTRKIVAGVVDLERQPCDLAGAVAGLVATLKEAGRFKQHTLDVDVEPVWVEADVTRLQQIITNLLNNAIKYTLAGGWIHVSVKTEGDHAVLRVHDSGIGISPDLLPRIFELFVQGDPGAKRVRSGLGIGLAVVHRLVELHDGTVEASSDGPGQGSTFTVRLPRVPTP